MESSKVKVLIVNTYDRGGAANACLRLHEGLLGEDVNSNVLVLKKQKHINKTTQFVFQKKKEPRVKIIFNKLILFLKVLGFIKMKPFSKEAQFLKDRPKGLEMFSFPNSSFDITASPLYKEADIINLHWVANFLDYQSFFEKNKKPVIWTLHDMNPFLGGEHYKENFLGIDENGTPILRKRLQIEKSIEEQLVGYKSKILQSVENLTIVTPSNWLSLEVKKSTAFKNKKVLTIPYGLNMELFKSIDVTYSRAVFNMPYNKTIVLFVADSINNNRKGFRLLKAAIQELNSKDVLLCAIGKKQGELSTFGNVLELGEIKDERLMAVAYSAADVFVIPSLMDNLPNTVLESLACGTPVIGFNIGGIPDMIEEGENGILCDEISSFGLKKAIEKFLNIKDRFDKKRIRENAAKKYDLSVQAQAYSKLFKSTLKD
ncbi:glycosyltransferase [Tamlana agarivorans]|uniref:Glycosyltransferase n=1 Tax=Pseudotamlana agarivorans TaxID=481183 RepID=A0ACC5UCU0_9FLAO|nr:glycosyltransferase [Tamlana agarivorans]MBU2952158.1 glycosyltransferase [Tamlana agarivorans]